MIEYTHMKVDGQYLLVASGHTVVCAPRASDSAGVDTCRYGSDACRYGSSIGARAIVGVLFRRVVIPVLREAILVLGGVIVVTVGWLTLVVGGVLFDGARAMLARSRLLSAIERWAQGRSKDTSQPEPRACCRLIAQRTTGDELARVDTAVPRS